MAQTTIHCLLPAESSRCTGKGCNGCGWSPEVAKARDEVIAAGGMTQGPDGVRRLIVRKGAVTNDSNT